MLAKKPPTSQKAGVKTISFILNGGGGFGDPLTLPIRPEELTRNEPSRTTVHQTMGRGIVGWVDDFGAGLPSVTLAGHTGWHYQPAMGMDGAQAFERLNKMVMQDYHELKQDAIDRGDDPASVQLIFTDNLDGFSWVVAPMVFVLRRSRSRPLLMQYNITLQAISTTVDNPSVDLPFFGSITSGLASLAGASSLLGGLQSQVQGMVSQAMGFVDSALAPISSTVSAFTSSANGVLGMVGSAIGGAGGFIGIDAGKLIGVASNLSSVGANVFGAINAIPGLPSGLKSDLCQVRAAFNESLCVFGNSLRPQGSYSNFDGLYGASNCSSTTGGRAASPFADTNIFQLLQPTPDLVSLSTQAIAGASALMRMDPVLAPLPFQEVGRHLGNIVSGIDFG